MEGKLFKVTERAWTNYIRVWYELDDNESVLAFMFKVGLDQVHINFGIQIPIDYLTGHKAIEITSTQFVEIMGIFGARILEECMAITQKK